MPYHENIYIPYNSLFLHCAHALVFMTSRRRHRSSSPFRLTFSHQVWTERRSRVEDTALFTVSAWLTMALSYDVYVVPVLLYFLHHCILDETGTSTATLVDDFTGRYLKVVRNIHIHRLRRSSHRRAYLHHIHCTITFQQLSGYNNLPVLLTTDHHLSQSADPHHNPRSQTPSHYYFQTTPNYTYHASFPRWHFRGLKPFPPWRWSYRWRWWPTKPSPTEPV